MSDRSSITPIPRLPPREHNPPRGVAIASIVVAAVTTLGQVIQSIGGLPEVVRALVAQGWNIAGALAVIAVGLLIFQTIRSADAARATAEERAERRDERMGQMLNELAGRDAEISSAVAGMSTALTNYAQALEGLRQQMIARPNCPMLDAKTDPAARIPGL